MRTHWQLAGLALLFVLVFALFAVAASAEPTPGRSAPGTTVPISRTTSTTTTLPPRPTTTTTTTTTLATTTTASATTTTVAPTSSTTTTVPETTTTTGAPPTITSPSPEPPPPPLTPTCQIVVWWGNGSLEPTVDPAYQNPSSDAGHLNIFGSGYVAGEEIDLLIDGAPAPVVGDGPPQADQTGRFLANAPNTGGLMGFIETLPLPFEITAAGSECSSSAPWGIDEPILEEVEEQSMSILPWILVTLGALLGGLTLYLWRRNR